MSFNLPEPSRVDAILARLAEIAVILENPDETDDLDRLTREREELLQELAKVRR